MSKSGSNKLCRIKKHEKRLKVIALEKRVALSQLTTEQKIKRSEKTDDEILEILIYDFNLNSLPRVRYPELEEKTTNKINRLKKTHFKTETEEQFRTKELSRLFDIIKIMLERQK